MAGFGVDFFRVPVPLATAHRLNTAQTRGRERESERVRDRERQRTKDKKGHYNTDLSFEFLLQQPPAFSTRKL